jgi:hypothetical protein
VRPGLIQAVQPLRTIRAVDLVADAFPPSPSVLVVLPGICLNFASHVVRLATSNPPPLPQHTLPHPSPPFLNIAPVVLHRRSIRRRPSALHRRRPAALYLHPPPALVRSTANFVPTQSNPRAGSASPQHPTCHSPRSCTGGRSSHSGRCQAVRPVRAPAPSSQPSTQIHGVHLLQGSVLLNYLKAAELI